MDKFTDYLMKTNPSMFFFDGGIAALRLGDQCDLLSIKTGEVLEKLRINRLSSFAYSRLHNKLYLKSLYGPISSYCLNSGDFKTITDVRHHDHGMFMTKDGQSIIAYTYQGDIDKIDARDNTLTDFYNAPAESYYQASWDRPDLSCYEFFHSTGNTKPAITQISYDGAFMGQKSITVNGKQIQVCKIDYNAENNVYVLIYHDRDHGNGNDSQAPSIYISIFRDNINAAPIFTLSDRYTGGCFTNEFFENYLFCYCGTKYIYTLNLDDGLLMGKCPVDNPITFLQYEPSRNSLYINSGATKLIKNIL